MELKAHICRCCGGKINIAKMQCEYCGTSYEDTSLERLVIQEVRPGQHTIACQVELSIDSMSHNPEGAREYVLRELRNQIADGLLGYMKIRTAENFSPRFYERTEIIRGEVRVLDPMFEGNW